MNRTRLFGATLVLALLAPTGHAARATGSTATIVFEWNQILQDSFPTQGVGTVRPFSMTHIAMFDAINTIERDFDRDNFMSAEGAKAYGIIDHVISARGGLVEPSSQPTLTG